MADSYINRSLQKLSTVYMILGVSYDINDLTRREKLQRRCVYIINCLWLNTDVLGAIVWFFNGIENGTPFVELTYIAPCIAFSFLANTRSYALIHYEEQMSDLIRSLKRLEENTKSITQAEDRLKIYRKETKFLHRVIRVTKIQNVILILTFLISPLVFIVYKYFRTKKLDLILPFLIIYPFDSHDIKYWPFVYLHQFWSETIVCLEICFIDFLLYICCTFIRIQFRLIQCEFAKLDSLSNGEMFERDFTQLVKWHQELIRASNLLEQVYSKSTLYNFISSSILICLTGFNVTAIENKAFSNMFVIFLSSTLVQIFFLCFFGDLLMQSSSGVSDAIYASKWYHAPGAGKNLHIVQMRAQKPCKLTAFGFTDVNLGAFMSILSTAWSYFALLKTIYSSPRTN
ncbi:unnamed protein product [Leptosia nina]|uniref:Odorant receptor n=1 Tax=Leptosia nina TaxID=320188 RepID=A0AAV1JF53_9NEOP